MAGTVKFERTTFTPSTTTLRTVFFGVDCVAKAKGDSDSKDWVYINTAKRVTASGGTDTTDPACPVTHTKLYDSEAAASTTDDKSKVRSFEVYIDTTTADGKDAEGNDISGDKSIVERLAKITNDSTKTSADGFDVYIPSDKVSTTDSTVNIDDFTMDVQNLTDGDVDIKIVFVCEYTA